MTTEFLLDDWKKIPARHIFQFTRGYAINRADMGNTGIPCVHYGDIHGEYGFEVDLHTAKLGRVSEPANYDVQDFISKGQFLFAGSSEDYEGSGNFTLIRGAERGIAGTDTIVLTPKIELPSRYIAYLFDSLFFREQIRPHMMGTKVFHPSQKVIKNAICLLPPKHIADSITVYLDEKTAEIDVLIEKLTRQMELLNRHRRELIAHTVTRGLHPNVEMRESNVEWIGPTPATWRLLRISALYNLRSTKVSDKQYPPLSVTMNGVVPQLDSVAKTDDGDNRKLIRAGDFVINSRSDRRGACGIAPQDGSCSLINIVLAPQESIHNPYYSYVFSSSLFSDEFYRWGHGIHNDLWTTNWSDMKSIQVPVPPMEEQISIANYLDDKVLEIDSATEHIIQEIELLGKYRKQIINDVVTGKIRVGEVA